MQILNFFFDSVLSTSSKSPENTAASWAYCIYSRPSWWRISFHIEYKLLRDKKRDIKQLANLTALLVLFFFANHLQIKNELNYINNNYKNAIILTVNFSFHKLVAFCDPRPHLDKIWRAACVPSFQSNFVQVSSKRIMISEKSCNYSESIPNVLQQVFSFLSRFLFEGFSVLSLLILWTAAKLCVK